MTSHSSSRRKGSSSPVAGLFRKIFIDDWVMKLVALFIAFTLWFGVSGLRTNTTARLKSVALNIKLQNDMELTSASLAEVDLFVTGDKRKVDPLNPRNLVASLDLTQMAPGERIVQLTPSNVIVDLPTGVSLDSVEPTQIPVKLERIITKELPVEPEFVGSPENGLEFYSFEATPKTVRVRGPEGVVQELSKLSAEKIDLKGKAESFSVSQLNLTNENQRVRLLAASVDIRVTLGPKRVLRTFDLTANLQGKPRNLSITLYGPNSELQNLDLDSLRIVETDSPSPEVVLPNNLKASVEVRRVIVRK